LGRAAFFLFGGVPPGWNCFSNGKVKRGQRIVTEVQACQGSLSKAIFNPLFLHDSMGCDAFVAVPEGR
jgi:hypothetical protein